MGVYRKKPVILEAIRFDGIEFVDDVPTPMFEGSFDDVPEWLIDAGAKAEVEAGAMFVGHDEVAGNILTIVTLEGAMVASPGDWIIRGTAGEIYPCKPEIFVAIYDPVDAASANVLFGEDQQLVEDPPGVGRAELSAGEPE